MCFRLNSGENIGEYESKYVCVCDELYQQAS
jgi:hypothetical protein